MTTAQYQACRRQGRFNRLGKAPGLKPVVGDPPDRQEIWDEYASSEFHPCDDVGTCHRGSVIMTITLTRDDEIEYDSCVAQWSLDSSNFLDGLDRTEIDKTGLTGDEKTAVDWYFNRDNSWLFIKYTTEVETLQADSTAYAKWQVILLMCNIRQSITIMTPRLTLILP